MTGTLVVGIVALVLSASSLTWQVVQFVLGSSRVFTELRYGAHNGAAAVTAPVKAAGGSIDVEQLVIQGYTEQALAVQVQNRGRMAVSVMNWSIAFDNGGAYSLADWVVNNRYSLPYRLEPGSEATWLCPFADIQRAVNAFSSSNKPVTKAFARVSLGNGKVVTSRNYMTFASPPR